MANPYITDALELLAIRHPRYIAMESEARKARERLKSHKKEIGGLHRQINDLRSQIESVTRELNELKARDERSLHALAATMSEYGFLDETWSDADWNRFVDLVRLYMEPADRDYLDSVRKKGAHDAP